MKELKSLVIIGLLALVGSVIQAAPISYTASGNVYTTESTTNWAVIPGELFDQVQNSQGRAVNPNIQVNFLTCRVLSTVGNTLTSYYATNPPINFSSNSLLNTVTEIPWQSTNGISAGQWIVIHHQGVPIQVADEAVQIASFQNTLIFQTNSVPVPGANPWATNTYITTNIIVTLGAAPLRAINAGITNQSDTFYEEVPGPILNVASQGLTTSTTVTGPSFTGDRSLPMLFTLTAASGTNFIDAINGLGIP